MGLLLDFAYFLACILLSPWILYRLVLAPGRRDFAMRFGVGLGERLDESIWLHGSSAGEVTLLRPLVALLERDLPGTPLLISAFTTTGLAAARKLYSRHRVVGRPPLLAALRAASRDHRGVRVLAELHPLRTPPG